MSGPSKGAMQCADRIRETLEAYGVFDGFTNVRRERYRNAFAEIIDRETQHARLVECLRVWLDYAESELSEFATDEECPEDLCPKCRSCGCIKKKIESARALLAEIEG